MWWWRKTRRYTTTSQESATKITARITNRGRIPETNRVQAEVTEPSSKRSQQYLNCRDDPISTPNAESKSRMSYQSHQKESREWATNLVKKKVENELTRAISDKRNENLRPPYGWHSIKHLMSMNRPTYIWIQGQQKTQNHTDEYSRNASWRRTKQKAHHRKMNNMIGRWKATKPVLTRQPPANRGNTHAKIG